MKLLNFRARTAGHEPRTFQAFVAIFATGLACAGLLFAHQTTRTAWLDQVSGSYTGVERSARAYAETLQHELDSIQSMLNLVLSRLGAGDLTPLAALQREGVLQGSLIDRLFLTDAAGDVIDSSSLSGRRSVGDLQFYKELLSSPSLSMSMSDMLDNPDEGTNLLYFGQRYERDGVFLGLVGARVRSSTLSERFGRGMAPGSKAVLLGADGAVRSRSFSLATRTPDEARPITHVNILNTLDELQSARTNGRPLISVLDGQPVFASLQPVPGYPVSVLITQDAGVALSGFDLVRDQMRIWSVALCLVLALAVVLIWVLSSQFSRAQLNVRRLQRSLHAALGSVTVPALEMRARRDERGRITNLLVVEGNPAAEIAFGPGEDTGETLHGKLLTDVLPSLPLQDVLSDFEDVLQQGEARLLERPLVSFTGRTRWYRHELLPLPGEEESVLVITHDISQDKEAESRAHLLSQGRGNALSTLSLRQRAAARRASAQSVARAGRTELSPELHTAVERATHPG